MGFYEKELGRMEKEMDTAEKQVNWTPWKQLLSIVFEKEKTTVRSLSWSRSERGRGKLLLLLRGSFIIEK